MQTMKNSIIIFLLLRSMIAIKIIFKSFNKTRYKFDDKTTGIKNINTTHPTLLLCLGPMLFKGPRFFSLQPKQKYSSWDKSGVNLISLKQIPYIYISYFLLFFNFTGFKLFFVSELDLFLKFHYQIVIANQIKTIDIFV